MIRLRELARQDIPVINGWRQDPAVAAGIGAPRRFITLDADLKWYDEYLTRRGSEVRCAVELADSAELVGMVSLTRIDYVHRNAEYNAMVGGARGRGVGTAATKAMVHHAFFDLNLHRLYVSILRDNVASIKMCANAGFREEGIIRDGAFKDSRYHDMVLMGVLRSDVSAPGAAR